jgi:hypothetical protein
MTTDELRGYRDTGEIPPRILGFSEVRDPTASPGQGQSRTLLDMVEDRRDTGITVDSTDEMEEVERNTDD